jgi:hypothetical protein
LEELATNDTSSALVPEEFKLHAKPFFGTATEEVLIVPAGIYFRFHAFVCVILTSNK